MSGSIFERTLSFSPLRVIYTQVWTIYINLDVQSRAAFETLEKWKVLERSHTSTHEKEFWKSVYKHRSYGLCWTCFVAFVAVLRSGENGIKMSTKSLKYA